MFNTILFDYCHSHGIQTPRNIKPTGFTRWGKNNCYYATPFKEGTGFIFGDFATGETTIIRADSSAEIPAKEIQALRRKIEKEEQKQHEATAKEVTAIYNRSPAADINHPYLVRKGIQPHGIKQQDNRLIIPLHDYHGKIWSLEYITPAESNNKRFHPSGRKKGNFFAMGNYKTAPRLIICEGFATGVSIHEALNIPVIVAFDVGNLESVVSRLLFHRPRLSITMAADNDYKEGESKNTGIDEAKRIAMKYGLSYKFPPGNKKQDFNDLKSKEQILNIFGMEF